MLARSSGVRLVGALACSWDYQKGLFSVFTLTIMHLVHPPKILPLSSSCLRTTVTPRRKLETMLVQNFGG